MHEIVSFSKEIEFKNMINKITSISLEHTLMLEEEYNIRGDFILSGTYKMTAATQIDNEFSYKIPIDITIDDKYDLTNLVIDIDNFTYEVVNDEILKVDIDLLLDKMELKKIEVEQINDDSDEIEHLEDLFLENDDSIELNVKNDDIEILDVKSALLENEERNDLVEEIKESHDDICEDSSISSDSFFANFDSNNETYSTYSVYIMREGDNVDSVISKYNVNRELLLEYNDLDSLKIGDKVIIPSVKDEKDKENN